MKSVRPLKKLVMLFVLSGCAHGAVKEPDWAPHTYVFGSKEPCKFVDGYGDTVLCSDRERLNFFVLIPDADITSLKSKIQRCEKWR
jgi:hypothetical protein